MKDYREHKKEKEGEEREQQRWPALCQENQEGIM